MFPIGKPTNAFWRDQLTRHNALSVKTLDQVRTAPPDRAVAFETSNFGWILSPKGDNGKRRVLLQY